MKSSPGGNLWKNTVIFCLLLASAALAQQKQRVAVLPSVGDLDPQRLILLTDKVREIATKNLPMENFNILKQDVITRMIGEEELYRSCKEGVCIGDLAKKTNANYGARCDVVKLDNSLVLKFELYSVNEEAIFETFTDYDVKDFHGMLAVLEARLPDVFKQLAAASKNRELVSIIPRPLPQPAPILPVPIIPAPDRTLADDRDKEREREQQRREAVKAQRDRLNKQAALGTAILFDLAGAGGVALGLYLNAAAEKHVNDSKVTGARNVEGAEKAITTRNAAYIIGGALLAAGLSIHIIF